MQAGQRLVRFRGVHRGLDDPGGHRVDAHTAVGVLDGQRLGRRLQTALGEGSQGGRDGGQGVVDQAGGQVHDVATSVVQQMRDRAPREAEEPLEVHADVDASSPPPCQVIVQKRPLSAWSRHPLTRILFPVKHNPVEAEKNA
ncbi:hypothetical protein GCM10023214_60580 [Amycolatopsis dongchuanensis]|uniref:Uncharacterized protein n=1 Tax=Amycolatopsis dongchuanensis TaxID=1070866 RepID=A0ABP8VE13_9PSEU